jgi:hypothetical protein
MNASVVPSVTIPKAIRPPMQPKTRPECIYFHINSKLLVWVSSLQFMVVLTLLPVLANTLKYVVGGILFIQAIRDLKKGEQLTSTFPICRFSYKERIARFANRGMTCSCRLCELDANDPNCDQRAQILDDYDKFIEQKTPQEAIIKGKKLLPRVSGVFTGLGEIWQKDFLSKMEIFSRKWRFSLENGDFLSKMEISSQKS